ncbi:MAG: hypothetical protein IPG98_08800 [Burkholderiales bacterium]|nr:hypothetical protein [Burkholderiales bacterium]MBK8666134.1 hypothetical protein [Burkholderiales bacterium]
MQAASSPALIEQSRRNAKRLAKQAGIPLHQAQDQTASQHGFGNWSQFVKRGSRPIALPATPAQREPYRFYLHGDESEKEPGHYYCAQCDLFMTPDHFDESHRQPHGEYAFKAIERFKRSPTDYTDHGYRPDNPPNLLTKAIEKVRRAHDAREASRSSFHRWIEQQKDRNDPVGDLAGDVMSDKEFPIRANTLQTMQRYLNRAWASQGAKDALKRAWSEFTAMQRP